MVFLRYVFYFCDDILGLMFPTSTMAQLLPVRDNEKMCSKQMAEGSSDRTQGRTQSRYSSVHFCGEAGTGVTI